MEKNMFVEDPEHGKKGIEIHRTELHKNVTIDLADKTNIKKHSKAKKSSNKYLYKFSKFCSPLLLLKGTRTPMPVE